VAAFFGGVVRINGILAILLLEFFQSIGWWEIQSTGGAEGAAALSVLAVDGIELPVARANDHLRPVEPPSIRASGSSPDHGRVAESGAA
jgi:hypothetical protein